MVKPITRMPGPKAFPMIGSLLRYTRFGKFSFDRMHLSRQHDYETYGKIYKEKLGPNTFVHLFDPEDISKVFRADGKYPTRLALPLLVASKRRHGVPQAFGVAEGEEWYRYRKSVNKLMISPGATTKYLTLQNEVADDLVELLQDVRGENKEVQDVNYQLIKYSLEAIGSVIFSERLGVLAKESPKDKEHPAHKAALDLFDALHHTTFAFPWYEFLNTKPYRQYLESRATLNSIAMQHMEALMKKDGHHESDGFLNALMQSDLNTEEVSTVLFDVFAGSIDSTGNALSFLLYNLSRFPEKQEKLYQHIQTVLEKNEPVTVETLKKLSYLKACVKESFRLHHPVSGGTARTLDKDMELGGYLVPKGTNVTINSQTMCLQNEWFDKEEEFQPERWLHTKDKTETKRPPPFVMMPFGYGPRMCIGRRFAEQEIFLATIKILQNFQLKYHGEDIGMLNRIFTAPDRLICITFLDRAQ